MPDQDSIPDFPFPPGPLGAAPEQYAELRSRCPVAPVRTRNGDTVLLVTRYDDIRAVLSDPAFSRNLTHHGAPRLLPGADMDSDPAALINMDPPEHTRLRRIVSGAFTVRAAEAWRPVIQSEADRLIEAMLAAGPPAELMADYAFALPMNTICMVLGIDRTEIPALRRWSDAFLTTTGMAPRQRAEAVYQFSNRIGEIIRERRQAPGGGLIDELIEAHDGGDRLSAPELVRMVSGIVVAGHETSANLIGRGVLTLLQLPAVLQDLRRRPERVAACVEEVMRSQTPGHSGLLRLATKDVTLPSGFRVSQGQAVLPPMSAANMDPARFPEPESFLPDRPPGQHIAFGYGPHFCLGANLARVELQVAFAALVCHLPELRLAGDIRELTWTEGTDICGPVALPVSW